MADARRVGVVVLVALFAVALLLAHAPLDLGAVRVGGVGLLWWYTTLAGPLVAVLVVIAYRYAGRRPSATGRARRSDLDGADPADPDAVSFRRPASGGDTRSETLAPITVAGLRAIAIWTSPVTFTAVAASVFWADANAPLLILAVFLAPLLALLQVSEESAPRAGLAVTALGLVSAGLIVWANLLVVGDLSSALGIPRWRALAAVTVVTLVLAHASRRPARWTCGVPLGIAGLALPVILIAAAADALPWTAWSRLSSLTTLSFSPGSAWVTEGRSVARPTSLTFDESHRVTATAPGVYRVTERDGPVVTIREWRLVAGDVLELRPGDQLSLPAGARVRFEAGRRVPGAAISGVAWADPPARRAPRSVADAIGLAVTLGGGAIALISPRGRRGPLTMAVPTTLYVFSVAAASWGVYAAYLGLDLGLGAMPLLPLFEAPSLALDSAWRRPFVGMMTAGLFTLSITAICGLQGRVAELWAARRQQQGRLGQRFEGGLVWGGVYASALVLSLWPGDAWRVLLMGLGLAASAWLVARVAPDDHSALVGSLVGGGVFAAMSLAAWHVPPWAAALALYPVLAAAPLAAAATVVLSSHASRSELPR